MDTSNTFTCIQKMDLIMEVNGKGHSLQVEPTKRLMDILRENLGLTGVKPACEIGRCGACSVLINGTLAVSCLIMAYQINHSVILTIEGLETEEKLHPIQQAFLEEGALQCGYCTPGMIMAVKALLDEIPNPTYEQMIEALSGNLCRCTGYKGIIRAVQKAQKLMQT